MKFIPDAEREVVVPPYERVVHHPWLTRASVTFNVTLPPATSGPGFAHISVKDAGVDLMNIGAVHLDL
jgi:hypothetical protein